MSKKIAYSVIILGIIAVSLWLIFGRTKEVALPPSEETTYNNSSSDLIVAELPFPGAVVGKDFSVIGRARGTWFFEASFPVEVLDKNNNSLAKGTARAESDWMTENFVPFKADIKIPESYTGPATLILKNDNPSGDSTRDKSISFPITIEY